MRRNPVIIGAGPAGLTAAYELTRHGLHPLVLEAAGQVGGLARTQTYKGYRFDIGGHRFFTKVEEVEALWSSILGDEFLRVGRLSRIYFGGRFFSYPLSIWNVLRNLGATESLLMLASYLQAQFRRRGEEESFEQWVINRFGVRLYERFFKTYTEKVWGIPCSEIRAEWAAQRIQGLSLLRAVVDALFSNGKAKTLIREFQYPREGPGQMWEGFRKAVERAGCKVRLNARVEAVGWTGHDIRSLRVSQPDSGPEEVEAPLLLSSMPLSNLVLSLDPPAPDEVLGAARGLRYRDFIIVVLILRQKDLFPDNWIYIHSGAVRVGRIQNFKNWSPRMVPDDSRTSLGMEYFCSRGDDLWERSDEDLVELAKREIDGLGLADASLVEDACVIRQPKAYPVYDAEYRRHLDVIRKYLSRFRNLQTIGRNGMHRYNNQDHSMLCGLYAARNLVGGEHDLWRVNTERSYHEEYEMHREGSERRLPGQGEAT